MNKRSRLFPAVVIVMAVAPAFASGFGFYEQGAKASAQGGAWVARADDASANWYNPAALAHLTGREVQLGINHLEVGTDTQFSSAPGTSFDAVSNTETPAHFYFSQRINDGVAWGVGLNNPFGLVSEWNDFPMTLFSRRAEPRAGCVIDESPVPAEFLRPPIPDADRTGYSLGYGYLSDRWGIDAFAMQLDFDDATANGSPADGVINGTYTSSILIAGVTAKYRF